MILDRLVLHNVGTFAGKHTVELTPPSPQQPIILVGGLNGAGKTTLLEAIQLVLYGPLAQSSSRRSAGYEQHLRGLIHKGVPASDGAAIELTFRAHQEGAERTYWVRRSWRSTGAAIREILLVSVDGRHDAALTSTWSEHVETFLPRGIAGLFFFDGEQIEALADMERSQQVLASALAALLGLDLVERLSTDLAVIRRRHRGQQVPAALRTTIEERQRSVTSIRQAEEMAAQEAAKLRVDVETAEKKVYEATERYRSAGGDLLDQRDAAEQSFIALRENRSRLDDELRDELASLAPLLQIQSLLTRVAAHAAHEEEACRTRVILDVVTDRDSSVIRQLEKVGASKRVMSAIAEFLAEDRHHREAISDLNVMSGLPAATDLKSLLGNGLPSAEKRLRTLLQRRQSLLGDIEQAERLLAAMPDPEALAPLKAERDAAMEELGARRVALAQAEERLSFIRNERARADADYEAALNDAANANLAADDARRMVEHIDRVRTTLEGLRIAATRKHVARISDLILESLTQLFRKQGLVTEVVIDPESHQVQLSGHDGQSLAPQLLSAGERQLLAVAMLWGLARAAGQPLPVVIDTPLGRLDGIHREHLLDRYFPNASHQVVLLSTNTEIDHDAYRRIAKRVGRSYRLEFDAASNASVIEPGYFWE